ncbi:hypothetical protein ACHAXR_003462, partial [Thalassiosira sp. AJA248-18]
ELGGLWNFPILMMDEMMDSVGDAQILGELLRSPPGRLLQLGTDALLPNLYSSSDRVCKHQRTGEFNGGLGQGRDAIGSAAALDTVSATAMEGVEIDTSDQATAMEGVEVLKQDGQKADETAVPTQLWAHFFRHSFLLRFGTRWQKLPEGWERALDGFRRHWIRAWRRRVMRNYRVWTGEEPSYPCHRTAVGRIR